MFRSCQKWNIILPYLPRVASGPGISGYLEKSGNFVVLEKSQGILTQNWEKSGNFTCMKRILIKFFKIQSSGEQELVIPVYVSHIFMDFYLRIKMNLNYGIVFFFLSFWIRKRTVTD